MYSVKENKNKVFLGIEITKNNLVKLIHILKNGDTVIFTEQNYDKDVLDLCNNLTKMGICWSASNGVCAEYIFNKKNILNKLKKICK